MDEEGAAPATPQVAVVPWFRQLQCALLKNVRLLSRRPIQVFLMITCSIASVMLAVPVINGRESDIDFGSVPLTRCGQVEPTFSAQNGGNVPISYNAGWSNGAPVMLMGMFILLIVSLSHTSWG